MNPTISVITVLAVVLVLQVGPLVHFARLRTVSPCLRSSYCLLYVMLVAMAWMGFVVLLDVMGVSWVWLLPLLAVPVAFWAYLVATDFRAAGEGTSCPIR
jgi:hypothetical protein